MRTNTGQLVTNFNQPYTLLLKYTQPHLRTLGLDELTLNTAYWDGTRWVNTLPCSGCGIDRGNDRVTIIANHFTEYALSGTNYTINMPMIKK